MLSIVLWIFIVDTLHHCVHRRYACTLWRPTNCTVWVSSCRVLSWANVHSPSWNPKFHCLVHTSLPVDSVPLYTLTPSLFKAHLLLSQDSSVGMVTPLGVWRPKNPSSIPSKGKRLFCLLGPPRPLNIVNRRLRPRGNAAGTWNWPPQPSAVSKNGGAIPPPPYIFMVWYLIKHKDSFTFLNFNMGVPSMPFAAKVVFSLEASRLTVCITFSFTLSSAC